VTNIYFYFSHGVKLSPFGTGATFLLYEPQMVDDDDDDDDCVAIGGKRIGGGNRSTRRRQAPVSLCPP
jgi:hypothetical protein